MSTVELTGAVWRKSSYSGGGTGDNCVELANVADEIAVRDSKNQNGPAISMPSANWQSFLDKLIM